MLKAIAIPIIEPKTPIYNTVIGTMTTLSVASCQLDGAAQYMKFHTVLIKDEQTSQKNDYWERVSSAAQNVRLPTFDV
jgi:hypothetical protein